MIKKGIKKVFSLFGFELGHIVRGEPNPIRPWDTDERFNMLYEEIKNDTLVDKVRCFILYQFFRQVVPVGGEIAEIGVYRGGTAKLLSRLNEGNKDAKVVHLFDTFSGMPETSEEKDVHLAGDFSDTSFEGISRYLGAFKGVFLHKGFFPSTADSVKDKIFSFVHIDVDIYKSVLDCCVFFYPRMAPGGVMIFDDYGFISCPGAKTAVDEFFRGKKETPVYLPSGQCIIVKL